MAITQEIDLHVQAMAKRYGVPVNLVRAVIGKETGQKQGKNSPNDPVANYWSADHRARSPAGAIGLMQLMPDTANELGVNPADIKQNIEGGVKYLKQQLDANNGDATLALASYNAGPGNVRKHKGVPPFRETRNYVNKINGWLPALETAFAGSEAIPTTTGVPSVSGTGTGAASEAVANGAGTDAATAIQKQYSAMGDAHKKSAESQRAYAQNIADMAGAAPDLAASVTESLAASNAALANFSAGSRAAVDSAFAQIEQKDVARRMIMQTMLTDKNLDPTVQGSIADQSTDNMAMLSRRMNATILAEQATNEMSIADNPAGFFEKMLFGNLYTQGRNELRSQFDDLKATTDGTLDTVNAQAKQATDVKIGDPALDKMKMDMTLKLAEIDKDVAVAQAETPVKIAEAKMQAMRIQADMMGYGVRALESANTADVQAADAGIKSIEAPTERAIREAQAVSASNAAQSGKMDLAVQKQFYDAQNLLRQVEIEGATAEKQKLAMEAKAALNAAKVLDASGALDTAALQTAITTALKATEGFVGTAASVGTGSAAKEVEARNAQFTQSIKAESNPKYKAMQEAYDMARFKAGIKEIETTEGSDKAIKDGLTALGQPSTLDISKYPPDVQNALKSVGQGQKAGVNPVTAAVALNTGGIASMSPELAATAQTVLNVGKIDEASGKIVPFSTLKPEQQEALATTEIQAAINVFEENKKPNTPVFSPDYIYGMLHPAVLTNSPHTNASQKKSLDTFGTVLVENPNAATSVESMIRGLALKGIKAEEAARIVSDVASASVQHNNATRKYNLLGLENQQGVKINYDPIGLNSIQRTELDMSDMADVQLLMMDMRARGLYKVSKDMINPLTSTSLRVKDTLFGGSSE